MRTLAHIPVLTLVGLLVGCVAAPGRVARPAVVAAPAAMPAPIFDIPGACDGPEYRSLDFLVGSWDLVDERGAFQGDNVVAPMLSGCALRESFTDADGARAESVYYLDRARGRWKQVWASSDGFWKEKVELPRREPASGMRFQGEVWSPTGGAAIDRTTLRPLDDGRVAHRIERSTDGGRHFRVWEGYYQRKPLQCNSPEHHQLDFWLGDWEAHLKARASPDKDEWTEARGVNHVTLTDNGCTVVEDFHAAGPGSPWTAHSLWQFVPRLGRWQATWVDEQNNFVRLTGGPERDQFVLHEEAPASTGGEAHRPLARLVWSELRPEALRWRWETSFDGGHSYIPTLYVEYTRHRPAPR